MSCRSLPSAVLLLSLLAVAPASASPAPQVALESAEAATSPATSPGAKLDLPQLLDDLRRIQHQTRLELARQQLDAGRTAEALGLLREALRHDPRPEILFEMARCSLRLGQLQQALDLHRRYVNRFTGPLQRLLAAARFGELLDDARRATATRLP